MLPYPLKLSFKIIALSSKIRVTDATGRLHLFARQKKFKLKEDIGIYRDEQQASLACRLQADRIIDFSAVYNITGPADEAYGAVRRRGARSLWSATYDILDATGNPVGVIREENPWIKVLDGLLGGIPFVSMFINPSYLVDLNGRTILRLKKEPAFFEGKFNLEMVDKFTDEDERVLIPSVIMALILERQRG